MTSTHDSSTAAKKKFWEVHIENWARSELNQVAYCRENNLQIKSFGYWKRKLTMKDRGLELVQLTPEQFHSGPPLRLHVGLGYQIDIPDGFSRTALENLLLVLREL